MAVGTCGSKPMLPFRCMRQLFQFILVGIGMFTGGLLTHGQMFFDMLCQLVCVGARGLSPPCPPRSLLAPNQGPLGVGPLTCPDTCHNQMVWEGVTG